MFPAAGHMALAIEAARQHCEIKQIDIVGMTLRNVDLKTALIVPETDAGLEIQLRLSRISTSSESTPSYDFSVESCANNTWTVHSEGVIVPVIAAQDFSAPSAHPVNPDVLSQRHTGKRWNDAFRRVRFDMDHHLGCSTRSEPMKNTIKLRVISQLQPPAPRSRTSRDISCILPLWIASCNSALSLSMQVFTKRCLGEWCPSNLRK